MMGYQPVFSPKLFYHQINLEQRVPHFASRVERMADPRHEPGLILLVRAESVTTCRVPPAWLKAIPKAWIVSSTAIPSTLQAEAVAPKIPHTADRIHRISR